MGGPGIERAFSLFFVGYSARHNIKRVLGLCALVDCLHNVSKDTDVWFFLIPTNFCNTLKSLIIIRHNYIRRMVIRQKVIW